eukprot:scaffold318975_cov42-Prasinocladus_malaysianus.AAC.2
MLVEMLRSGSELEHEAAAGALRNLAMSDKNCERIVRAGAVPLLVDMLSSGNEAIQEVAAGTIENLLLTEGQELVSAREVVPPLVVLLMHGDPSASDAAAGALEASAKTEEDRVLIGSLGAIPRLAAMVVEHEDEPDSAALALGLLENLATVPANATTMVRFGVLEPLVQILRSAQGDRRGVAACVACNLAQSPEHCAMMVEAGVVPPLLGLLEEAEQSTALEAAANALNNLALCESGVAEAREHGASGVLCRKLKEKDTTKEVAETLMETLALVDDDAYSESKAINLEANLHLLQKFSAHIII